MNIFWIIFVLILLSQILNDFIKFKTKKISTMDFVVTILIFVSFLLLIYSFYLQNKLFIIILAILIIFLLLKRLIRTGKEITKEILKKK